MISNFDDLLKQASQQDEPQRLLFLFAKTETKKKNKAKAKMSGIISPVMCVDKLPQEVPSFKALVSDADNITTEWDFVIVASLSGEGDQPPTSEAAEPHLNQMANILDRGEDLSRFVIFDRENSPVQVQAR